jgi:hypothetical protein
LALQHIENMRQKQNKVVAPRNAPRNASTTFIAGGDEFLHIPRSQRVCRGRIESFCAPMAFARRRAIDCAIKDGFLS